MVWADFLTGIVALLVQAVVAVVSIVVAPLDLLVNALAPQATQGITDFFQWVNSTIQSVNDFIIWFLFVLGITPATWSLTMLCLFILITIFVVAFPIKMIVGVFRGLR